HRAVGAQRPEPRDLHPARAARRPRAVTAGVDRLVPEVNVAVRHAPFIDSALQCVNGPASLPTLSADFSPDTLPHGRAWGRGPTHRRSRAQGPGGKGKMERLPRYRTGDPQLDAAIAELITRAGA